MEELGIDKRMLPDIGKDAYQADEDYVISPNTVEADEALLFGIIRAAFGQRRKTLVNAVSAAGYPADAVRFALCALSLSPTVRAEELTLSQFAALSAQLADVSPRR